MKNLLYALLIIISFNITLYSKTRWNLYSGLTSSSFKTMQSKNVYGFVFGAGTEWQILKGIYIGSDIFYTTKGGILKDKIVGGGYVKYCYLNDIHCLFRSVEIPVTLKYGHKINKGFRLTAMIGPALSIALKDKSSRKRTQFLFEVTNPDEWDEIEYDYEYYIDTSGPLPYIVKSSGIAWTMGLGLEWSFLRLECRYLNDHFNVETLQSVFLDEKLHAIQLLFGISI